MDIMRGRPGRMLAGGAIGAALILTLGAASAPASGPQARSGAVTDHKFALYGVSVLSSSNAWAVGQGTTVLHWNGKRWARATIPDLAGDVFLYAVDAISRSDVWAAGESTPPGSPEKTLIVHWNGTAWKQVPSPGPSNTNVNAVLTSVSMDSATDGWAIGYVYNRLTGATTSLALHWNGKRWHRVAVSSAFFFSGVASFSRSHATAVGTDRGASNVLSPAAFRWNGSSWVLAAVLPRPRGASAAQPAWANAVDASSATNAWAVGARKTSAGVRNLAWHWNGRHWTVLTVPSPGITDTGNSGLVGVAAISPANVWAVGFTETSSGRQATVSVHWNGQRWIRVRTPDPGGSNENATLSAVAAAGRRSVWAVGHYDTGHEVPNTLILRWTGSRWIQS